MVKINAYKMDGLGNDFIIIDRRVDFINLSKEKIIELGHRANIGFDQIIFVEKEKNNSFPITIFNSDGGEINACGNGSRCIAYLLSEKTNSKFIKIKTNNRLLDAEVVGNLSVKLNMGQPIFEWDKIPLAKKLDNNSIDLTIDNKSIKNGFCLNVGNPHIVFFVKNCFEYDLRNIGPKIENHSIFPERTNVTFAQIENKKLIKINVWERGAGLTKACGTAACATAVAALKSELTSNKVEIKFNEGVLDIEIDESDNIFMTGPVSEIKNVEIDI
jgi:diaminopimelate epimerase